MQFSELDLSPGIQEGLEAMGFKDPTPVQELAIPHILKNQDIVACAQTGTGKTAAFLLPVMSKIEKNSTKGINTLVIAPTRELAQQIDQQAEGMGYFAGVESYAVYGGGDGSSFEQEKQALTQGADIIIGTPGRLKSHLKLGYVNMDSLEHLILDEADRMLDMGFFEDIMEIISFLPEKRQTLLFSATMPDKIRQLANKILNDPAEVKLQVSKPAAGVMQGAYVCYDNQKIDLIKHLLKGKDIPSVIIFSSTKKNTKEIARTLKREGFNAQDIHSDLEQDEREEAIRQFRARRIQIVVATDVLSRGIDIEDINLVINYDVPGDGEDYVHRIGRTARASSTGVAITFIGPNDQRKFKQIEELIETEVNKIPMPPDIGDGPEYSPGKSHSGGGKGRGNHHHKGNRKHHRPKGKKGGHYKGKHHKGGKKD